MRPALLPALPALLAVLALAACSSSPASGKSVAPSATPTSSPAPSQPTWTMLPSTPPDAADVTFAPSAPQVGYVCTSVNRSQSSDQPKLYKTSDGGQHWQLLSNLPALQPPASAGTFLVLSCRAFVAATDANDVFLQQIALNPSGAGFAVARALHRSRDGGATWGPALATLDRTDGFDQIVLVAGSRLLAKAHPSVFGASGCDPSQPFPPAQPSTVLYSSDDGGHTWQPLGQPIENQHLAVVDMAPMGETIVATAHTLSPGGCGSFLPDYSLWRSADGGATWQRSAAPAPASLISYVSFAAKSGGSGSFGICVAGTIGDTGMHNALYFTADDGATWAALPPLSTGATGITDPSNVEIVALAVTPTGAVVALAYKSPQPGGPAGVFAIRPGDAQPAWTTYAPATGGYDEQVSDVAGGTLWLLDRSGRAPSLSYLPLP